MSENEQTRYRDDLIRARMSARNITVEKLKELSGVAAFTITQARKGRNVNVDSLRRIAVHLDLPMRDIFDFEQNDHQAHVA